MQPRTMSTTMEPSNEEKSTPPPSSRGRHNSKLKLLGRSHAMREEASPPRESSPTSNNLISPSIQVIPSTETSPEILSPLVVFSPSITRGTSPCPPSPTSTLVPSPNENDCEGGEELIDENDHSCSSALSSPKYMNRVNNNKNLITESKRDGSSHSNKSSNRRFICDCSNQGCIKCLKNEERNFNNNLTSVNNNVQTSNNTLTVASRSNSKSKLKQQSSSQGSFDGSSSTNSPSLSRDNSSEQYATDTTGVNLSVFIPQTLNRNAKDRALMLRIEQELVNLAKDRVKTHYKFPPMSSYQRMLVHRCAAYFGMDHNVESSGKCVVVNKTKTTRIPEVEFKKHIKEDVVFSEEPRRSILKRDSNSIEDYSFKSPDRQFSMENRRSKSFEEREEEYEKVRRRIFNRENLYYLRQMHDGSSNDELEWPEIPWSSTDSENSSRFRLQLPEHNRRANGKLIKVLSEETGGTERPYVAKSYSFGGYGGVLNRGDSVVSTHSAGPRLLTKQDSAASSVSWRLSPSSSGYKSQSQMSESVTPSPTSTPHPISDTIRQDSACSDIHSDKETSDTRLIWAVTDIQNIPKGSLIIDPESGLPLKNEDGSLYYYDPSNPPSGFIVASKPPPSPKKNPYPRKDRSQSPKKRCNNNNNVNSSNNNNKNSPSHSKSHVTNSSTSPSLPYSPPPICPQQVPPQQQHNRGFQFLSGMGENIPNIPTQQFPGVYNSGFVAPPAHETLPVYQQPCIVYTAPYGVPVSPHYDARIDPPPMGDMGATYYMNMAEANAAPPTQSMTYQPASSYWNQQPITFYQNTAPSNPTPPQRFPVPMHQNQPGYISSFPQNYQPPPPPPPNPEILPVYPSQSVQVVYSAQPNQGMYPNQSNIVYAQNPVYPGPPPPQMYPQQNIPQYPQNTSTPNSCTSSLSHTTFSGHVQDQNHQNVIQLAQSMSQMSFIQNQNQNYAHAKMNQSHFDLRQQQKVATPKAHNNNNNNKFNTPKNFFLGSSQSSTGTNSPAATVIAGYCPQNPGVIYRTPPETPPTQFGYGPGFHVPPMLFRQISNVRANTPGTARSSRSPTPASDIQYFDRQRMPLPPAVYHGMPYVLQSDSRIIPGRGQPNAYRHPTPVKQQNIHQGAENNNRSHKNRKSNRGNKPPNGKPMN